MQSKETMEKTYRKLEAVANRFQLTGDAQVTLTQTFGDDCACQSEGYQDEIFIESGIAGDMSSILANLPIDHLDELYRDFVRENPIEKNHDQYMWKVGDEIYCYEEVLQNQADIPGFDEAAQNIHEVATPTWDEDILSEWINENSNSLCNTLEWNLEQYDYKRGYATVTAPLKATLEEVLSLEAYNLRNWTVSVKIPDGTLTLD